MRGGGKRCGLLGLLRCDGLESVVSLMTSSLRCSLLSSARMASVELRCGRLQPVESNLLVVLPVVDYDAQRSLAAANVAAEVQTVRSLVNKLGKAQRAAEETLEMCDD